MQGHAGITNGLGDPLDDLWAGEGAGVGLLRCGESLGIECREPVRFLIEPALAEFEDQSSIGPPHAFYADIASGATAIFYNSLQLAAGGVDLSEFADFSSNVFDPKGF